MKGVFLIALPLPVLLFLVVGAKETEPTGRSLTALQEAQQDTIPVIVSIAEGDTVTIGSGRTLRMLTHTDSVVMITHTEEELEAQGDSAFCLRVQDDLHCVDLWGSTEGYLTGFVLAPIKNEIPVVGIGLYEKICSRTLTGGDALDCVRCPDGGLTCGVNPNCRD
jgi:hypothetical protein